MGPQARSRRSHGRSPAHPPAHPLRSRDDQVDGLLPRHRNYSRHFSGRLPGEPPPTLLDYFPRDFLLLSMKVTPPFRRCTACGSAIEPQTESRRLRLRLPSAVDNRPLKFEEFENRIHQTIYVSATPGPYELTRSAGVVVEQVIRPTGLVDPQVEIRPVKGQIDDLLAEIRDRAKRNERVLVTTSPSAWPRTSPATTPRSACAAATCIQKSKPRARQDSRRSAQR